MNRAQQVFAIVVTSTFFFLVHRVGAHYYERQDDPSFGEILLFRLRLADFAILALWALCGFLVLRQWEGTEE